jgi:hypothetical protein
MQVVEEGDRPYRQSSRLVALAESSAQGALRKSPLPEEPAPPWWRYAVRPILEPLHEGNMDVGNADPVEMEVPYGPLPEMEIGEPNPAFFSSQDNGEDDIRVQRFKLSRV